MSIKQGTNDPTRKKVLIIGGGIAGLSCAGHLSKLGLSVIIAEKKHFIGGQALNFFCKATDTCQKCNYCLVEERLSEIVLDPRIKILTRARLEQAEPLSGGSYAVSIRQRPEYIDPSRCNNCGICYQSCPAVEEGAIIKGLTSSATHPIYDIDDQACLYFKDSQARLCQDTCPEKAIDLDRQPLDHHLQVDAVVLATGYTPFDPLAKPALGYGRIPNIITAMELEKMIRIEGEVLRPSDQKRPGRLAFIQCIGSRDRGLNHLFCSRVCCGYALRMGGAIKHRWPEIGSYVFYMDIQNFGKEFIPLYEKAKETLTLIRGIPGSINPAPGERISLRFQENGEGPPRQELFDLLVLSIGLMPAEENKTWAEQFQLPIDADGFLTRENPLGIFTAGTITGPMDIAQSISHGGQAALQVARYLGVKMK
ncbi:MAG: CoB--CoM heterodisulfide reductase iron-sulfur subunit A family protein [Deltaproteobacteria bacterium]|nr:CoB--CoM heterodisulfide reductase iron-sulfur subunit A family protein [Deltaproteobacteria bacterium]